MSKSPKKNIKLDFPAKLIRLGPLDSAGYPRVAPTPPGFRISHSWQPQGGVHARIFGGRNALEDVRVPERYVCYVDVEHGATTRVPWPPTASTASLAPTSFSFTRCVVSHDPQTHDLLIASEWTGRMAVVFWKPGTTLGTFAPVEP